MEERNFADIQPTVKTTASGVLEKPVFEKDPKMKLLGKFSCRVCNLDFTSGRALCRHSRIHFIAIGPHPCCNAYKCPLNSNKKAMLIPRTDPNGNQGYECLHCKQLFISKGNGNRHLRNRSCHGRLISGPYRCKICLYVTNKTSRSRHMKWHNTDRLYKCALCTCTFIKIGNCKRHLRKLHGITTRDQVERAIIYHTSLDSSVENPSKKSALVADDIREDMSDSHRPVDMSMDALDLSKKTAPLMHNGDDMEALDLRKKTMHNGNDASDAQSKISFRSPNGRPVVVSELQKILQSQGCPPPKIQFNQFKSKVNSQRNFENNIREKMNDSHLSVNMSIKASNLSNRDLYHDQIPKFNLGMLENNFLLRRLLFETSPKFDVSPIKGREDQMYQTFGFSTPSVPVFHPALLRQNHMLPNDTIKIFFAKDIIPPTQYINPFARSMDPSPVTSTIPVPPFLPTPQEPNVLTLNKKQPQNLTKKPFTCEYCSKTFTRKWAMNRHITWQHGLMRQNLPLLIPKLNAKNLSKSSEGIEKVEAARNIAVNSFERRAKFHSQIECVNENQKENKDETNDLVSV